VLWARFVLPLEGWTINSGLIVNRLGRGERLGQFQKPGTTYRESAHLRITITKAEGIYMITGGTIHGIFSGLNSSPQFFFKKYISSRTGSDEEPPKSV
jgi:hypothetical protein